MQDPALGCGEAGVVTGCLGYLRFFLNHEPHPPHYLQLSVLAPFILYVDKGNIPEALENNTHLYCRFS